MAFALPFSVGGMKPADESYFIVYVIFAITNSIFTLLRAFVFAYAGICAAKTLHKRLLDAVINVSIQNYISFN